MATPANRVPVRIARGSKANLDTAIAAGDLKEGEICYATDENGIYVVEGGALTQAGADLASTSIDALSDVDTTTAAPTDGQVLIWNNVDGEWQPGDTISDVVSDTTPQLGGNLDVNGNYIVSASGGNVEVAPDTTGDFVVRGNNTDGSITLNCTANTHGVKIQSPPHADAASYTLVLPSGAGTAGQVLTSQGGSQLTWEDAAAGSATLPTVTGTFIDSDSTAATTQVLTAPTHNEGDLLVAVIMNRVTGGTLTPPSGWTLHGSYLSTVAFSGTSQDLQVFTKTATASEPASYTWTQASSSRICGYVAAIGGGAEIVGVTESYGNATTATIATTANRLNLTAATWVYANPGGAEGYSQTGAGVTEITDSPNTEARISGGYTTQSGTVTSTHDATSTTDNPNHGMINIAIRVPVSISDSDDVDTVTTPPTDGQALIWDNAAGKWEPGTVSGGGGAATIGELTDVQAPTAGDSDFDSVTLLVKADGSISDQSPSAHTLTNTNVTVDSLEYKYGSGSADFAGNGALITPTSSDFDFSTDGGTVEFWFYLTSYPGALSVLFAPDDTTVWAVWMNSSNNLVFWHGADRMSFTAPSLNTWHHVALTYNPTGTEYRLYMDGADSGSNYTGTAWSVDGLRFGSRSNNASYLTGQLDEIRVTKGVLRYTGAYTSPTEGFATGGSSPADGQLLAWDNTASKWEPSSLQGAAVRTALGIGEYADDAAAGTGGVASGALYYNTTSSDYRLKT